MNKRTKTTILVTSGIVAALVIAFMVVAGWFIYTMEPLFGEEQEHQPDAVMIDNFLEHRDEFERLREMVVRDRSITRVDNDWTHPENLPKDLVEEYRRLFKTIGTPRGISARPDRSKIDFIASARGWVASGSTKGYSYIEEPPRDLENSLDEYNPGMGGETYACRHIEGKWYLFFER